MVMHLVIAVTFASSSPHPTIGAAPKSPSHKAVAQIPAPASQNRALPVNGPPPGTGTTAVPVRAATATVLAAQNLAVSVAQPPATVKPGALPPVATVIKIMEKGGIATIQSTSIPPGKAAR